MLGNHQQEWEISSRGMGNYQQRMGSWRRGRQKALLLHPLPASLDLAALLSPHGYSTCKAASVPPHSYSQPPSPLFQHPALAGLWEFHNPLLVPFTLLKPLKITSLSSLTSFQLLFELTIFPLGKEQPSRTNSWPQPGTISTNLWGPVMMGQAPH